MDGFAGRGDDTVFSTVIGTIDSFNVVKVRGGRFGGCFHYFKSKYNYDVGGERDRWSELSIYDTFLARPRMI